MLSVGRLFISFVVVSARSVAQLATVRHYCLHAGSVCSSGLFTGVSVRHRGGGADPRLRSLPKRRYPWLAFPGGSVLVGVYYPRLPRWPPHRPRLTRRCSERLMAGASGAQATSALGHEPSLSFLPLGGSDSAAARVGKGCGAPLAPTTAAGWRSPCTPATRRLAGSALIPPARGRTLPPACVHLRVIARCLPLPRWRARTRRLTRRCSQRYRASCRFRLPRRSSPGSVPELGSVRPLRFHR